MNSAEKLVRNALEKADIVVNGDRPWDIRISDSRLYERVLSSGSLGFGEAYMDGWWDADAVDQLIYTILSNNLTSQFKFNAQLLWTYLSARLTNFQRSRAFEVAEKHYDLGNELFEAMLDRRMAYSCGYWHTPRGVAGSLDEAQENKLDLICRKIGLERGQHVLDIGSGWGSFLGFAAERYGARGTGVSVSKEQVAYVQERKGNLPIETKLQDYRSLDGTFDHVVSVGMFEHVGYKNYRAYMEKVHSLLSKDGLFLLHTIGGNRTVFHNEPWSAKYIFPHGMIPSIKQIGTAADDLFSMEDWHNFGPDYDLTLMAWFAKFDAAWPELQKSYDERFYRMWKYYLMSAAASFRARHLQLWQIVFSHIGARSRYIPVR